MTTRITAPERDFSRTNHADVVVLGAGLIGLAIALELYDRGALVTVIERGKAVSGASIAAAGMLAVDDPCNPPQLHSFSQLSADRYASFLQRIEALCGIQVPFQTQRANQYFADGSVVTLSERSLDPRQLAEAVLAAVRATSIRLLERTQISSERKTAGGFDLMTSTGETISAAKMVYAAGAWTTEATSDAVGGGVPMAPRKGQMLRVKLPPALGLQEVHRSEHIYIVPRTSGPQAGTAVIGATVEDAGFDTAVVDEDVAGLRALASELLPELAAEADAAHVEAWAGLRPLTPDSLPVIGQIGGTTGDAGRFVASGHYRNGILQAPATALVLADLMEGKTPAVDLSAFDPERFTGSEGSRSPNANTDIRPGTDDNRSFRL
jgi:glycine oxidase